MNETIDAVLQAWRCEDLAVRTAAGLDNLDPFELLLTIIRDVSEASFAGLEDPDQTILSCKEVATTAALHGDTSEQLAALEICARYLGGVK